MRSTPYLLRTVKNDLVCFSRTMRALDADGISPALLGVILVAGLAGVWTTWLVAGRVPVYQLSAAARLEVDQMHRVTSPIAGRVVSTPPMPGREVEQGEVLLEVERARERLETVSRDDSKPERWVIRAPAAGRLDEVSPLPMGAVIHEGESLASIIRQGEIRAVAEFGALSLGRLQPGQPGRLRLDGFPWTQYGYIDAIVTSVQTRDQTVRVELAIRRVADSRIPLLHGMPGVVEVEVERVAPLALLVRSLGHRLSTQTPAVATLQPQPARTP